MKKFLTCTLLSLVMLLTPIVSLAENTTTLTTTVPEATYTLSIPADQEITYGSKETRIGSVKVTESSGFGVGKDLDVKIDFTAFTCPELEDEIPISLTTTYSSSAQETPVYTEAFVLTFAGTSAGSVSDEPTHQDGFQAGQNGAELKVLINSSDWGKAFAGTYTSTLTFTAEVVKAE